MHMEKKGGREKNLFRINNNIQENILSRRVRIFYYKEGYGDSWGFIRNFVNRRWVF